MTKPDFRLCDGCGLPVPLDTKPNARRQGAIEATLCPDCLKRLHQPPIVQK